VSVARTWPDVRRWVEIVYTLAQRDFQSRFRGNWLGAIGVVAVPALFLVAYTFVFSTLMPVKIRPDANREDYAFFFFSGLIGWTLFADATARAPRLFAGNVSFVRKALFPLSALPAASTLVALFHALIWFGVFLAVRFVREGELPASALGTTDMGNVSHRVPAIHPMIAAAPLHCAIHNAEFAEHAGSPSGDRAALDGAKALAMTALDFLLDAELRRRVREGFEAGIR